jgi:DNA-binding CsgD family transcriptional regulator
VTDEWPLVGRGSEIDRVGELLADQRQHGVVLVGPAGVGKSRIALEATAVAERAGFATVRALASESAAGLPLGAFAALLPAGFAEGEPADLLQRAQAALLDAAGGRPLFALIDDAHHLDPTSASLTRQLVATGAAFVLVTVRDGEQPPDAVTALWKDELVDRIDVRPLAAAEIGQLLRAVLGSDVDPALTAELMARSGGNVLFLRELLVHGLSSGAIAEWDGVYRARGRIAAGERLTELVEARLRSLTGPQRRMLELIALGEPLTFDALGRLGELQLVEQLEQARLVSSDGAGLAGVARLSHPIYGDVLRARLTAVRHAALNGQLVDAHEPAGSAGATPLKIALWSLAARRDIDGELLLRAAREAHALGDAGLTERLAALALEQDAGFDAAWLVGEAYAMSGRAAQAEDTWARLAEWQLDDAQRVQLSTHRFLNLVVALGAAEGAMTMLDEQTELVSDPAARIAMRAPALGVFGMLGRWQAVRDHYPALADQLAGLPRFVADLTYIMALVMGGRTDTALTLVDEHDPARLELAGPGFLSFAFAHARAEALLYAGALAEAATQAEDVYAQAVAAAELRTQVWLAAVQAKVALARGLPRTAMRWARLAASTGRQLGQGPSVGDEQTLIVRAAALLGEVDDAEAALRLYESSPMPNNTYRVTLLVAQADVAALRGSTELARERLAEAAALLRDDGDAGLEMIVLHDIVRLGYGNDVAARLAELGSAVDGPLSAARAAHTAALVAGDAAGLDAAAGAFADIGANLLAAEAAADASVAWHRAGDMRRSRSSSQRAAALAAECEGARTPALSTTLVRATLTPSQRRVATLAANGRSNKEIAAELVLSVRTVENTLARVYSVLGIRSRSELADALRMS